jgi:hypothetical protein
MPDNSRESELLELLQAQEERLRRLEAENALLRQKIDLLVRRLFGAKSEKLDPAQLLLLCETMRASREKRPSPWPRRRRGARRLHRLRVSAGRECPHICR